MISPDETGDIILDGCPDGQCCIFGPSPKGTLRSYVRILQTIRNVGQLFLPPASFLRCLIINGLRVSVHQYIPSSEAYFREGVRENPSSRGRVTPRGYIRCPHGYKAVYNREITFRQEKNRSKTCICAIFVVPLQRIWN